MSIIKKLVLFRSKVATLDDSKVSLSILTDLIKGGYSEVRFITVLKGVTTRKLISLCDKRGMKFNNGVSRMVVLSSLYNSFKS